MTNGRLFLLPVPLLPPNSPAALETIPEATAAIARGIDLFFVENAKSARAALKAMGHPRAIASLSLYEIGHAPDRTRVGNWLSLLANGRDAAIMSEAGCPAVADPGAHLVAQAHDRGIEVKPLVGPSAIMLALMGSGANGQLFRFIGYLPQDRNELTQAIEALQLRVRTGETQVAIETPYRNEKLLDALIATLDAQIRLTVAVDLTGAEAVIKSAPVAMWREDRFKRPSLHRRPAIFVLGCANAKA